MPVPTSDVFIAAVVVDLANIVFLIINSSFLPAFAPTARVTRFPRGQAPDKEGSTLSLDASVHRALQRGWQEVEGAFNYDCRAHKRLADGLFHGLCFVYHRHAIRRRCYIGHSLLHRVLHYDTQSKGNHIWSVDARKLMPEERANGGNVWVFRHFERRIAGNPSTVAYVGVRWSFAPRVWDPQAPRVGADITWSSPDGGLPSWLRWERGELAGMPDTGDEGGEVHITAMVSVY